MKMKSSKTLYELLHNSVEQFPKRVAFHMLDGEEVTYEEVGKRVETVQELLVSAGLKPGDKVVSAGGIYGVITKVEQDAVRMEIAPSVTIKIAKTSIVSSTPKEAPATTEEKK